MEVKLHLGCGDKLFPGWVHVDARKLGHVDHVCDLRDLREFEDGCVDDIYACHVLEHFGRREVSGVLEEWARVLREGGRVRIAVPDFAAICSQYSESGAISEVLGLVCGGQRDEFDYHKMIFDFELIKGLLEEAGLEGVRRYDWRETEHATTDDYSQSYLPHMDKDEGRLMSLNVEAFKPDEQHEVDK
ncbi:methyltransferase domain-containing protein [Thioalkalivibrio sp. AKL10]|uniref:class I SAM-dependent methyltransferase n=1 Tax=Thioalkalivibrio sp. AKL10 TaxID=1158158 RepID=UPI000476FDED